MNIDIFFVSSFVPYFVVLFLLLQPHPETDWVATNSDLPTIPNKIVNPFLMTLNPLALPPSLEH